MTRPLRHHHSQAGFTLIELLVVIGIIAVIIGLSIVNLGQPQSATNGQNATDTLVADIKSQQLAAMSGKTGSSSSQQPAGIYVQPGSYTLFTGGSYSAGAPDNYTVTAPSGTTFATTFTGDTLLFDTGTGDVNSFASGSNIITVSTASGTHTLTIDRFGAVRQ